MIRIVCRINEVAPDGNLLFTEMKTFDVECEKLENWLGNQGTYHSRSVIGAEPLSKDETQGSSTR